jgi:hypothetical protein
VCNQINASHCAKRRAEATSFEGVLKEIDEVKERDAREAVSQRFPTERKEAKPRQETVQSACTAGWQDTEKQVL